MDDNVTDKEKTMALGYCAKHLHGVWTQTTISDVSISRLTGGMSNLLYLCTLHESITISHGTPRCVLLRLYGPSHQDDEIQLEVFNKLASENLGPRLYASFEDGRLEEYMPSSALKWSEMTNDKISAVIAKKIALIHKLNFDCLEKRTDSLTNQMRSYAQFIDDLISKQELIFTNGFRSSTQEIASKLIKTDFDAEIDFMTQLFRKSNAPLVFSHNDLHQNNIILMRDYTLNNGHTDFNDRIVLIDFEYCSYNFRTFDMANHLSEWCFDYNAPEYPYFSAFIERFPSDTIQKKFLANYLKELGYSDTKSVDILYNEMQPFLMAANLLWALWAIKSAFTSKINFGYWEMAKCKWEIYVFCKNKFTHNQEAGDRVQAPKM